MSMLDALFGLQNWIVNGTTTTTRQTVEVLGRVTLTDVPASAKTQITIGPVSAAAAPVSGAHTLGEIIYNSAPISGGYIGWVCTVAGTPGAWKTWGVIS